MFSVIKNFFDLLQTVLPQRLLTIHNVNIISMRISPQRPRALRLPRLLSKSLEPLSIYVHWPYCTSKCTYCNFNKYVDPDVDHDSMERALVKELETELQYWNIDRNDRRQIRSVYFGGGTPSLARPSMFASVLEVVDRYCRIDNSTEISMEGNPSSTLSLDALKNLRSIGINRYSLGIQTFSNQTLKKLGRDHSARTALRSLLDARSIWPGHVSMDLIMGHADQSLKDWQDELRFTMDIVDNHLSLYHLTVEPGTALFREVGAGATILPGSDITTEMYESTIEITNSAGFEHYEISNFAKSCAYSQHNSGHWEGVDYLGIGPGAHGRMHDHGTGLVYRTMNIRDPSGWMQQCFEQGTGKRQTVAVDESEWKQELVVLGMRTKQGVSLQRFCQQTGQALTEFLDMEAVTACVDAGLLLRTGDRVAPTERGMAVADEIVARILP